MCPELGEFAGGRRGGETHNIPILVSLATVVGIVLEMTFSLIKRLAVHVWQ